MDIIEISTITNRTPGSIISRLCKLGYIPNRTSARGYVTYKNSELYKSIVSAGESKKSNKQTSKTPDNISISINGINPCEYTELKNEVKEIKHEMRELKNSVKELIEMMKAVYEFQDH